MMKRIWRLPEEERDRYDLSSLQVVWHLAEPCPDWLKQVWIDWLGPERIFELYGGTEGQASTVITGQDWLAHRGSVGRPVSGEIMIADPRATPSPGGDGRGVAPLDRGRRRPTGTSGPRPAPERAGGSRSATSVASTRRGTSTSGTACRT
jgi:acyl-CoA synthetase (AMP-forming)/AMP-acid ligase II